MEGIIEHDWLTGLSIIWWLIGLTLFGFLSWVMISTFKKGGDSKYLPGQKSTLDILRERYARGEIDKQEFKKLKKELK